MVKWRILSKLTWNGSFLVVHAHGNNSDKIMEYVSRLKRVLGTTQSTPVGNIYNFGGFTDGDRALFFAVEWGAKIIILAGMDFGASGYQVFKAGIWIRLKVRLMK